MSNNSNITDKIKTLSEEYFSDIVSIRRHLHRHPELSTFEKETAEFICLELDKMNLHYRKNIGGYGICGIVEGKNPRKKCVALRADMDALPIQEETGLAFASLNKGVMHACGHDIHISSLLGAIRILNTLKEEFEGSVMFLFQPSEEFYPGGAYKMLHDDVFKERKPESIFAFHTTPEIDCGTIGMKEGKCMASTDEIYIDVQGKGGHGATPEMDVDPIVAASAVVLALQQIVSRKASPLMPTVFSVGKFIAEGRTNIIPSSAHLEGIIRTFDENWRKECHRLITDIAQKTAEAWGCTAKVFIDPGYPYVYNNPKLTGSVFSLAQDYLGKDNVLNLRERMTAEDFSYFSQIIPACYWRLGTRGKGMPITNLHTSTFNVDENCLKYGMGLSSYFAISSLLED